MGFGIRHLQNALLFIISAEVVLFSSKFQVQMAPHGRLAIFTEEGGPNRKSSGLKPISGVRGIAKAS
jgi:hypothetical protein